jgi:hypothetical protein
VGKLKYQNNLKSKKELKTVLVSSLLLPWFTLTHPKNLYYNCKNIKVFIKINMEMWLALPSEPMN